MFLCFFLYEIIFHNSFVDVLYGYNYYEDDDIFDDDDNFGDNNDIFLNRVKEFLKIPQSRFSIPSSKSSLWNRNIFVEHDGIEKDDEIESSSSETGSLEKINEYRRDCIKEAFLHGWNGYKKYAWRKDELKPISKGQNNFLGGIGMFIYLFIYLFYF
jgi:hypothetical protein